MRMYRQTLPEYRALVVENERDFRRELVYLVESIDFGISVTGEAADFDEALACLAGDNFDLLITDINLTDAPRFAVGHRDGIALAERARELQGIPSIFLTAFADYDPMVVTRAAACDPIGFIQKQGDTVSAQTRSLISLALRRLDAARREREARQQLEAVIEQVGRALLYIDGEGRIVDFSDAAADLLEQPPDALLDARWDDVLRIEAPLHDGRSALDGAITAALDEGESTQMQALALRLPGGASRLASALALPAEHLREPCALVLLRDVTDDDGGDLARLQVAESACLALVGFVRDRTIADYDITDRRIAMLDLQALLLAQVRPCDRVIAAAAMHAVQLPATTEREGVAILAAILASVETSLQERYPGLTLRAGVAERLPGRSMYATAAAAMDALDRAQQGGALHALGASRGMNSLRRSGHSTAEMRPLLDRGFAVTEAVLRIPLREGRTLADLAQDFGAAIALVPGLCAFGVIDRPRGEAVRWLLCRCRDAAGDWRHADAGALPEAMITAMDSDAARDPGGLRVLYFDELSLSLGSLQGASGLKGLAFILAHHSGPPGRSPTDREKELSSVAARHLAQLVERCVDYNTNEAPGLPISTPDYNPWLLQVSRRAVAELSLLLGADTPAALVSESGMARAGLLAAAIDRWQPEPAWPLVDITCELWPEGRATAELLDALHVPPQTVLLLREPQHLPPRTQSLLGEALRTRALPLRESRPPLPTLRFAVTLPETPAELAARGELAPCLASALDAGVLRLEPLRGNSADCRRWAQVLLDAECALAGVPQRRFTADAWAALEANDWVGNLTELRRRVRRAVTQSAGSGVSALDLDLIHLHALP